MIIRLIIKFKLAQTFKKRFATTKKKMNFNSLNKQKN